LLFNTLVFWLFYAVVFALYRFLPHRRQNGMLLLASYVFYGWWDWRFLGLIWLSTALDFVSARMIDAASSAVGRRAWLMTSVVTNLGLLGLFKYFNFFASSLVRLMEVVGVRADEVTLNIILPVGISFYTFQTMSYTIEVYRGNLKACRNFTDLALYVAFFPQLVAGPIERAGRLLPQIERPRRTSPEDLRIGAWLCLWGLFKKMVIADNLGLLANKVFAGDTAPAGGELLVGIVAFAFQIYCDFSGYSDIARGLARTMGFRLMRNFNIPYLAANPSEFWNRWHISLSSWLRDYLYIPLGGNRRGRARTWINLLITMLLGGLWHGASWLFVLWGVYHGILLVAYRLAGSIRHRWRARRGAASTPCRLPAALVRLGGVLLMFVLVCGSWVLFRAPSLAFVIRSIQSVSALGFQLHRTLDLLATQQTVLILLFPLTTALELWQYRTDDELVIFRLPAAVRGAVYALIYFSIIILGTPDAQPFIYFQF
jgi:D-alanyl-lipoteichoic acid acyltransferase DltB (MBOAT superfamily)